MWLNLTLFLVAGACGLAGALLLFGATEALADLRLEAPWKWAGVATMVGADCFAAAMLWQLARRSDARPVRVGPGRDLKDRSPGEKAR